jgi:inorganic pyrophosphatase
VTSRVRLCVSAHDPRHANVQDIGDFPEFDRMEITHFFEVYKDLDPGKSVEGSHWEDRDAAYAEIDVQITAVTQSTPLDAPRLDRRV